MQVVREIRCAIYDLVVLRHQGSFSAEHGIGPYNLEFYQRYTGQAERNVSGAMQIKFDPSRLLGLTWFGTADTA